MGWSSVEQGAYGPLRYSGLDAAGHDHRVVMGTHGRRGIARAVLGSVTDTVMLRTRCPVLLLSPEARIER